MVKAVYWQAFSDIFTCQKPLFRSMQEKYRAPTMLSMVSCIQGRGYESFLVLALRCWKSIQKWKEPSFFLTNTMALHQGDWEGQMAPPSSISWICCLTSSTSGGAMWQNLSLNGLWSSSLISCSVMSVHPISWGSKEKMSWYSSNSLVALAASLDGHVFSHSSPPSFSRVAISSLCLSSMLRWGLVGISDSSFFNRSGEGSAFGTALDATTRATILPHGRWIGLDVMFLIMTETWQLLGFMSVYACVI